MSFLVHIVASGRNGTIYVNFTKIYDLRPAGLVRDLRGPGERLWLERRIREWRRSWKLMLIEKDSRTWSNLYDRLEP